MLVFSFINIVSARYRDLIGKIYRGGTIKPGLLGFIRWIISLIQRLKTHFKSNQKLWYHKKLSIYQILLLAVMLISAVYPSPIYRTVDGSLLPDGMVSFCRSDVTEFFEIVPTMRKTEALI